MLQKVPFKYVGYLQFSKCFIIFVASKCASSLGKTWLCCCFISGGHCTCKFGKAERGNLVKTFSLVTPVPVSVSVSISGYQTCALDLVPESVHHSI